jgi:hypothetical protein
MRKFQRKQSVVKTAHRYWKTKNRLLKFCYVPATSAACSRLLFFLFLLWLFTVLMKQTRQAVRTIKQPIFLDVYDTGPRIANVEISFVDSTKRKLDWA